MITSREDHYDKIVKSDWFMIMAHKNLFISKTAYKNDINGGWGKE